VPLLYVGRPWRASPSEGYPTAHLREQDRIVRGADALRALCRVGRPLSDGRGACCFSSSFEAALDRG
jgi:hypothetical protein